MIYTVTFNPSIDYYVSCDNFEMGKTNRTKKEEFFPGGKGINVSIMIKRLGLETVALGFVGGFTGNEIRKSLADMDIDSDFIELEGRNSRINVKLEGVNVLSGTEINANGPTIEASELRILFDRISQMDNGNAIVMSGSIPKGVPSDTYEKIAALCEDKGIRFIVDAEGDLLMPVLKYHPFLIKPNQHELGSMFEADIDSFDDAVTYGRKLCERGAQNVIVSMGDKGAVLVTSRGEVYYHEAVSGEYVSSVGAGDSMIAGFITEYMSGGNGYRAFLRGIAAASATVFSSGLGDKKLIDDIFEKLLTSSR